MSGKCLSGCCWWVVQICVASPRWLILLFVVPTQQEEQSKEAPTRMESLLHYRMVEGGMRGWEIDEEEVSQAEVEVEEEWNKWRNI